MDGEHDGLDKGLNKDLCQLSCEGATSRLEAVGVQGVVLSG